MRTVPCPSCQHYHTVTDQAHGTMVCSKCRTRFEVPADSAAVAFAGIAEPAGETRAASSVSRKKRQEEPEEDERPWKEKDYLRGIYCHVVALMWIVIAWIAISLVGAMVMATKAKDSYDILRSR